MAYIYLYCFFFLTIQIWCLPGVWTFPEAVVEVFLEVPKWLWNYGYSKFGQNCLANIDFYLLYHSVEQ